MAALLAALLAALMAPLMAWASSAVAQPAPAPDPAAVARGAVLVASRQQGLCVLCHAVPGLPAAQHGTVGPSLAGVGSRWTPEQLRERLLAPERFNPDTVMPSYGRTSGFNRVAPAQQGKPLLQPVQIDDVVAWLAAQR